MIRKQLASLKQRRDILMNSTLPNTALDGVGDASPYPYLSMTLNCLFWTTYSLLIGNHMLVFVNGLGLFLSIYYNYLFFNLTENKDKFVRICCATVLIYILGILYVLYAVKRSALVKHLGFIAATASISMIASPLLQLRVVLKKKNAESIPHLLVTAATLCSVTWWVYGVLVSDRAIWLPNAIGAILGSIQLLIKLVYRNGKKAQVFSLIPGMEVANSELKGTK